MTTFVDRVNHSADGRTSNSRICKPVAFVLSLQLVALFTRVQRTTHNLQFHGLALQLNGPDLEVDANGTDVALCIRVVGKPEQQTRLQEVKYG